MLEHVDEAVGVGRGQSVGLLHVAHVVDHEGLLEVGEEREQVSARSFPVCRTGGASRGLGAPRHPPHVVDDLGCRVVGPGEQVEPDRPDADVVVVVEFAIGDVLVDLHDTAAREPTWRSTSSVRLLSVP